MPTPQTQLRHQFFEFVFGKNEGYVCIATAAKENPRKNFLEFYFKWPTQQEKMMKFIDKTVDDKHLWFGINLLSVAKRLRQNCLDTDLVWADLDTCNPQTIDITPSASVESSPGRYQAYWRMDQIVDALQAEDFSKRIAYTYKQDGADPSGWDLTQLLRVPFSRNFKYTNTEGVSPTVELLDAHELRVPRVLFDSLDRAPDSNILGELDVPMPPEDQLPTPSMVLYKFQMSVKNTGFHQIYTTIPGESDDWSKILWRLINICFESGMDREEAYVIAATSKCNKYERDGRNAKYLWRDVLKAELQQKNVLALTGDSEFLVLPQLVTDKELEQLPETFIDKYKTWGEEATDAVPEFHELSAFILASAVLAGSLELKTKYGVMYANLWGLMLGDSTLTRKTTAMRMATDILNDIDPDVLLASSASAEGLLTALSVRPAGSVSMFYRDEVSGLFSEFENKNYLAGMPEIMTNLYDVPTKYPRMLRQETIIVEKPVFIFFAGGIKDKTYSLLNDEYVLSGFLPRFLVVSGDTDLSRIRPTGPATPHADARRHQLKSHLADCYDAYVRATVIKIAGQTIEKQIPTEVVMSDAAWLRYQQIETAMTAAASASPISSLALPTFERLSRSIMKMSMLVAALRMEPKDHVITVESADVLVAAKYVQGWGRYSIDLLNNAGRSKSQKVMNKILSFIRERPGCYRSEIMRRFHLNGRDSGELFDTLELRGEIHVEKIGRGFRYWAV